MCVVSMRHEGIYIGPVGVGIKQVFMSDTGFTKPKIFAPGEIVLLVASITSGVFIGNPPLGFVVSQYWPVHVTPGTCVRITLPPKEANGFFSVRAFAGSAKKLPSIIKVTIGYIYARYIYILYSIVLF